MLQAFWVYFDDREPACIEAPRAELAIVAAHAYGRPREARLLPYPREPRLGLRTSTPSLCIGRYECEGKKACPRHPVSCSD